MYPNSFYRELLNIVKKYNDLQYLIDVDSNRIKNKKMNLLGKMAILTGKYPEVYDFLEKNIHFLKHEINQYIGPDCTIVTFVAGYTRKVSTLSTLKLLLDNGADKSISSPLISACHHINTNSTMETVELLLNYGYDPNYVMLNYTVLFKTIDTKNINGIKLLLRYKADINQKNNYGETALMYTCGKLSEDRFYTEIIKLLLKKGADPNIISNQGQNALMILSKIPHHQSIFKILMKKTDLSVKNKDGVHIRKLCLPEYKHFFKKDILMVTKNMNIHMDECLICAEENNGIVCKNNHFTCLICLEKTGIKCEYCRTYLG